ncbi:MAG: alpha-glucuronidase family glycosyl hydrolase, partial [Candidatus Hydrogenedens sp.]
MQFSKNFLITIIVLVILSSGCAKKPSFIMGDYFIIVKNGTPQCSIVIPENCIPSIRYASEELQRFIKEMSGAELPIITDSIPIQGKEIILGKSKRLENIDYKIDWENLGEEGYNLRVTKDNIIIAGGDPRGTLYGVYGVLDDHLGCRWFTSTVSRIPKMETIALPAMNEIFVPPL